MSSMAHYRLVGHAATIGFQLTNGLVMLNGFQEDLLKTDIEIKNLYSMQFRFLTIWNVIFQLCYAGLGLTCDGLTVLGKDDLVPKSVRKLRNTLFESAVFPVSLFVVAVFWPLFILDRSLLFPVYIDKVISFKSNLVMHLVILPTVLWESAFQPKTRPKSDKLNLQIMLAYYVIYNIVITYSYYQTGLWPYPLVYVVYGTLWYPIAQAILLTLGAICYMAQWEIHSWMWSPEKKTVKNN